MLDLLTWPAVGLVLGLVSIFRFAKPFARLIERTERIGKNGLVAFPKGAQQVSVPEGAAEREQLLEAFTSDALKVQEAIVRTEIRKAYPEATSESERLLVKYLAATQLALHFERVWAYIFDSQFDLLTVLNQNPAGESKRLLQTAYENMKKSPALDKHSFDEWIGFLIGSQLIAEHGDRMTITTTGKEFLKYLVEIGKGKRGIS
jgi:hypothetical protein